MVSSSANGEIGADHATERFDVVISGASGSGLALAIALSQGGGGELAVAVVDRSPAASVNAKSDIRAYALSAGAKEMLETLGIWADVARDAEPVTKIEITDSSLDAGIRPVVLTYDNLTTDGQPASFIVPSAILLAALRRHALEAPGLSIREGEEAVATMLDEGGRAVVLASGRRLSGKLVVAAEGRGSRLREAMGIKIVSWSYRQAGIVTVVAHERPHNGVAVQHFLPAGPFAILPMTGQRSCITWSEEEKEAARILALDDAQFLAEVERRFGGRLGTLSLTAAGAAGRQSWPLGMHLARSYVGERFALLGDAAHGVHPIAGQGLNLGLRDAAALAEVILDSARLGLDFGNLARLERYERWRRFDSVVSTAAFDGLNRLFSNDSTILRAARDVGLGLVDRLPALKQLFVAEAAGLTGELPRLMRGEAA